jgi:holo-ACP synthase
MRYNAEDILNAREQRVEFQDKLIKKYNNTLIMIRVNYPGVNKNNYVTEGIINIINKKVLNTFTDAVCYKVLRETAEGPIATIVVDMIPEEVKRNTMIIEDNHALGRFVDIDVYNLNGKSLSRSGFGHSMRKCYLCDSPAQDCVRAMKHKQKDIIEYIGNKYKEYEFLENEYDKI